MGQDVEALIEAAEARWTAAWHEGPTRLRWTALPPQVDVPILSDPDRATYEAYGLLQGDAAQILFDAPDEFLRCEPQAGLDLAASRHGTDRALVDDPWQLPGEFVIDTAGVIRHAHRYSWCEDYPDPRVLIAVLRGAAGRV